MVGAVWSLLKDDWVENPTAICSLSFLSTAEPKPNHLQLFLC